jgi:hypothetical protein
VKKLFFISILFLSSCAKPTVQHPGALNSFDNNAYDTLRVEEKTLLSIKADLPTTPLLTPAYNLAKEQYNTTIAAYKTYHLALQAGSNPDTTALSAAITDLVARVAAIFKVGPTK